MSECGADSPTLDVPARRLAEVLSQGWQRGLDDLGQGLRHRIVVEVDGFGTHEVAGLRDTTHRNAAPIVLNRANMGSSRAMSRAIPVSGG